MSLCPDPGRGVTCERNTDIGVGTALLLFRSR